jgi:hypothetical protein
MRRNQLRAANLVNPHPATPSQMLSESQAKALVFDNEAANVNGTIEMHGQIHSAATLRIGAHLLQDANLAGKRFG